MMNNNCLILMLMLLVLVIVQFGIVETERALKKARKGYCGAKGKRDCKKKNKKEVQLVQWPPPPLITFSAPIQLVTGKLIGTIPNPPRTDFMITFTLKPFSIESGWNNLLRFTHKSDYANEDEYGDRAPLIKYWGDGENFHVGQSSTTNNNHHFNAEKSVLEMNEKYPVKLEYLGDKISLYLKDKSRSTLAWTEIGSMNIPISTRPQLNEWFIFASGKFHEAADAQIEDLTVKLTNLCRSDSDCDDNNQCTIDTCINNKCSNVLNCSVCGKRTGLLELTTDSYPDESSWDIKNSSGNEVYQGNSYSQIDTLHEISMCLVPDTYTFTAKDSYSDGFVDNGGYILKVDGVVVVSIIGGFGNEETKTFIVN